ncbi:uncharacterized protein [Hetaerina americana]|uniref:uncharacterized protein n=1 Tax=Hetaerina americana TaxID=62018 RepID=UPI003A7F131A
MDPMYGDTLCRFCLCGSESLIDLFEGNGQHGFIIEDAIEDLLRFKVSKTDGYPPFICSICFEKLNSFRLFKCQCNDSRMEYANRCFRKGSYGNNEIHNIPPNFRCIKQEPEDAISEGFVPCEVSIKTESEDMSGGSLVFKEVREISDDNYSEGDDGEEVGEMQVEPDIHETDQSYFDESTSMDQVEVRLEAPQKRKSWDKVSMIRAVEAVINKEMSLLKASKAFNVPRSTIKDYVKKNGKNSVEASIGRKPVLPADVEGQLVHYCLELERSYFGLTPRDVEAMAYHLATRHGLKHPFSDERQAAGRKWVKQFFRRHPHLSYRKPPSLAAARVAGFTRRNVERFFCALEPELVRINFSPERLFCVDETILAVSLDDGTGPKVLALKGRAQFEALAPAERGTAVTLVSCMSASGQFVPPLVTVPSADAVSAPVKGLVPGAVLCQDDSGWLQSGTFVRWLRHFVSVVKPTPYRPVVLVLDAHYAHNRNIDVMEYSRSNGVSLVCLPPHSSHKMHPMETSFIAPLRLAYAQEVERWRSAHGGAAVTTCEVPSLLLGKAYKSVATVENAAKGFWKTGISPFQRNAFGDHDYASNSKEIESRSEGIEASHDTIPDPQQPGTSGRKHLLTTPSGSLAYT